MIRIIKGVYGYRNQLGLIEPKNTASLPFSLTKEQEARLVKRGVAAYVDSESEEVAPRQPETLEEQLKNMSSSDLKKLAKEKGVGQGKKEDMIAAILELEQEGEDVPEFDAELPC